MAQNALIVKSRFQFKTSGLYGLIVLIFDTDQKILAEDYIYASRFSDMASIDVKLSWNILESQLNTIEMKGNYATSITSEIKRAFRERLDPNYGLASGIVVDYELRNKEKIHSVLSDLLVTIQKDKGIALEVAYEVGDLNEIQMARTKRSEEEVQQMNHEEAMSPPVQPVMIEAGTFLIPASPILSPVRGVPCANLYVGQRILMKLNPEMADAAHWAQSFQAVDVQTKDWLPIVGTISQIGPIVNKTRDIVVDFGHNRVSRLSVESSIKVKTYDALSRDKVAFPHLMAAPNVTESAAVPNTTRLLLQSIALWLIFAVVVLCGFSILIFVALSF
ncbi:MAG: hypothetical protein ACRCY4_04655 [Brevinema sp.]